LAHSTLIIPGNFLNKASWTKLGGEKSGLPNIREKKFIIGF